MRKKQKICKLKHFPMTPENDMSPSTMLDLQMKLLACYRISILRYLCIYVVAEHFDWSSIRYNLQIRKNTLKANQTKSYM